MNAFKQIPALALALSASSVFAAAVVPAYDSFGTLAAATFGGTGIPNTAVAMPEIRRKWRRSMFSLQGWIACRSA